MKNFLGERGFGEETGEGKVNGERKNETGSCGIIRFGVSQGK